MKHGKTSLGFVWYLGAVQYCVFLFAGGALWFLAAQLTGFFGNDPVIKVVACLLLLALILVESWWAHMPGSGNEARDFTVDIITSAAIAGFGMAVVAAILLWLPGSG